MKPEFTRAILFSLLMSSFAAAQAVVQQIGFRLPSDSTFGPTAINNNGEVSGYGIGFEFSPALSWQNGKVQTLSLGTIAFASAQDINNRGQIVGYVANTVGPITESPILAEAFLYDGTKLTMLPTLQTSIATAINDNGTIAGEVNNGQGVEFASLWIDGKLKILDTTPNRESAARDVNNNNTAVGFVSTATSSTTYPAIWEGGNTTILGTLGGLSGQASAINDSNVVVGASQTLSGVEHAFEWKSGKMQDLGVFTGDSSSIALSINDAGYAVGGSVMADGYDERAVLWQGDKILDLNALLPANSGWTLTEADSINDKNQIVGLGTFDGHQTTFLLNLTSPDQLIAIPIDQLADPQTAVPEPTSAAVVLGLLPALSLLRRCAHRGRNSTTSIRRAI